MRSPAASGYLRAFSRNRRRLLAWLFRAAAARSTVRATPRPASRSGVVSPDGPCETRSTRPDRFGSKASSTFRKERTKTYGYARGVPQPVGATLARELLESGRLDEVADLLARYRERMRPPAAVVERLAAAYRERGRIDRAIDLYRSAADQPDERGVPAGADRARSGFLGSRPVAVHQGRSQPGMTAARGVRASSRSRLSLRIDNSDRRPSVAALP